MKKPPDGYKWCPECGGYGGVPGSDFGDYGWHPCFHCGTSCVVKIEETGRRRWSFLLSFTGGHKYFFDLQKGPDPVDPSEPWVAIADESGEYPDETEDGTLYLDRSRPILHSPRGGFYLIPILTRDNQQKVTFGTREESNGVALRFKMRIQDPDEMAQEVSG